MDFLKTIAKRKSTRSYKNEQIKSEELNTILKVGSAAPVGYGAYDSIHMTAIRNPDLLRRIAENTASVFKAPGMNPFYGAPTAVIISAKKSETQNIEYANVACIVENMSLAATDLGLGSVYLWGFILALNLNDELLSELNLPEGFVPISGIALGYPVEDLSEKELNLTIGLNIIE